MLKGGVIGSSGLGFGLGLGSKSPGKSLVDSSSSSNNSNSNSSNNNIFNSTMQTTERKPYKIQQYENVLNCENVDLDALRKLSWNGVPEYLRPTGVYLFIYLSIYLFIYLSIHLYIYIYLSIYLSI
jgi:hypothetical protein